MEYFVNKQSITRKIWGKADTILFIFAGSAAEFALNKAVDWLYFTGKLPADPIGRLFSTVCYARLIVFSEKAEAYNAIDRITSIHTAVEKNRQASIPDWAYRDVLYMLIYYSITSFEVLERKLSMEEKEEVFQVFYRVGVRMNLKDLPTNYNDWVKQHAAHLSNDLRKTSYTIDLFKQYKKHLGSFRYRLLIDTQKIIVPPVVKNMLDFNSFSWVSIILPLYKLARFIRLHNFIKSLILPAAYKQQIKELDMKNYEL